MKKTAITRKPSRKTTARAKTTGNAILADLTEFAETLQAGIAVESKYTVRCVARRTEAAKIQR